MKYKIMVFTLNGCSHCVHLKDELKKEGLEYEEYEVGEYPDMFDKILEVTKMDALPTLYIQNTETNKGPIYVAGRDFMQPSEAVTKIKKYIEKNGA